MAAIAKKITLSSSRDIPFNKLVLSQANVRRVKAGVSVEELAEDVARRGLLQGLSVRPVKDEAGVETGMFEIPAGGRRYRALDLLVRQKRLSKTAPVPCIVREEGIAEEDSLAENVQRAPLHPLDQFRAFLALREKGQSEEEIAAAFFVSVGVVKQRLKLASVSPALLEIYAEDGLTLDQLMAFTVSGDHERQQQVLERLKASYDKQPYAIRRMLTEGAVRASDKRVQFIGIDAYVDGGGTVMRDLFQGDDGGWLQDVVLVDRLVADEMERQAEAVRAEGWKWIEIAPDFAYGHAFGLRQLRGEPSPLSAEEELTRKALQLELDRLSEEYDSLEDLPDEIDQRLAELETGLQSFETRPLTFDPLEVARAGGFISIAPDGCLRVERGYVRPEDELPIETQPSEEGEEPLEASAVRDGGSVSADNEPLADPEEDDRISPISDRLMTELMAHRTLGLRQALGGNPDIAFLAALHAFTLKIFYQYGSDSCLELDLKSVSFGAQAPGLNDSTCAQAIRVRHDDWANALPKEATDLWDALRGWDRDRQAALFAHAVSMSVNAVHEAWNRRPRALAHADRLAQAITLDMTAAGWRPSVDNFFGRVTKARILQALTEAKGQEAADRIAHLKKGDMASEAEKLIGSSGWLPEPLRTPGNGNTETNETGSPQTVVEATAGNDGELSVADTESFAENDDAANEPHTIAAG
ncbi:DNA-binding protein [Mesorhizobium sp. M4A.F.Ca.ET.029.04.2.1]|nr:DNA-binding protein [Mesorhizobium sp. M4A.F.Ca.ET.029.04.2.1]